MADSVARLACYDALPLSAPVIGGKPSAPPQPMEARAAAPAAPRPPSRALEGQFGLAPQVPAAELEAIESHIPGLFEGWRPNDRIRLANGQVWQIVDDSSNPIQRRDPKVSVRRGALGAFYLDIEGDNRSPRVRRVQ